MTNYSSVQIVKSNLGFNASLWMEKEIDQLENWSMILKESCDDLTFGNTNTSSDAIDPSWEYSSALFLCMSLLTTIGNYCVCQYLINHSFF